MPECSDSMSSSIFMPENLRYHHFTWNRLNSQEILNFVLILFGSPRSNNWNKIHNFLEIQSNSNKIIITCFLAWKWRNTWNLSFFAFLSKTGFQKYSAWVSDEPTPNCFYSVISLSEEIYKFFEPDCSTIIFSLLSNILIWFM